ncbi:K(+)/H(+) antiporter NhaP2 [Nocardioides dokdonensis FR1436]|uniref:K(+)/H(+) antiporter NhaP2 n=1 Tax=Nocardioides dokdonensis FR1436 TaxID=1300347 RepID=A0A1A9GPY6_9ACTN|nr:cation:proton antiporter [Nocardioides dokdonensis]ANH40407.1 K(+)/H(+) antiporter NhaP2 [Nocardioides dokdonensis FR1436]
MSALLLLAVTVLGYALVSQRLALSPLTAPMVFTGVGLLAGAAGLVHLDLEGEVVTVLVEVTLTLVLFTDAIRIDLRALRRYVALPARLLGVGLPLTILAGTAVGALLLPGLGLVEAALLAAVLAPTDAALGQAVVSDPRLPVRIRQALNVESGLNDGIALPVVTVLLAVVVAEGAAGEAASGWWSLALSQVGFGVAAGLAAGLLGGWLLDRRAGTGAVQGVYRQLAALAVVAAAYAGATLVGGNGFIAAFTAGMAFGHVARAHCSDVQDFSEDEGELLTVTTFLVFGAVLVGPVLDEVTWRTAAYAVCSLTVVRLLPVLVALARSGTLLETRLFLGWFGPRGLASILFALLVVEETTGPAGQEIFEVACLTVLLSVVLHGLSASTWAGRLAARLSTHPAHALPERGHAPEMPTRRRLHP